jgi:hypothetical protein
MDNTFAALSDHPDTALLLVAEQINELRKSRQLKYRPRLHELHEMCTAASPKSARLDAELRAIFSGRLEKEPSGRPQRALSFRRSRAYGGSQNLGRPGFSGPRGISRSLFVITVEPSCDIHSEHSEHSEDEPSGVHIQVMYPRWVPN